jgi:hypothetical protein
VLLSTHDGWHTVANDTPAAVPTNGGLVVARSGQRQVAAVGAYQNLVSSPILTKSGTAAQWQPGELTGAVVDDRNAVSLATGHAAAVITASRGSLVTADHGRWATLTSATDLVPDAALHLDAVTWATSRVGWLTGHGPSGTSVVFRTTDTGRSWTPVPVTTASTVAALAPCGAGRDWLLPVISGNSITVHHTTDGGDHWSAGAPVAVPAGTPAWGCQGQHVWLAGRVGSADHVFSSLDAGRSWVDRGEAPAGLSALVPESGTAGFAASVTAKGATLWTVTGDGARFTVRPLPGWVARLGAQESSS